MITPEVRKALVRASYSTNSKMSASDVKLTATDRAIIHIAANSKSGSQQEIADLFGITQQCVSQIKLGTWRRDHGTGPISGVTSRARNTK